MKSGIYRLSIVLLVSVLIYWVFWNAYSWISPLHLSNYPIIRFVTRWCMAVIPMIIALFIMYRPKCIIGSVGLDKSFVAGAGIAFLFTLPLYVGFSIAGNLNMDVTAEQIICKVVLAAFFEELVFRGFMFGQLFRYCKIGFFWAAVFPAVLFGVLHVYQGHDLLSSLTAFGVTLLGAFYFSWIYVEWNFNLWVPIGLHLFMNLSWSLFSVEGTDNATGGLISNILRVASIALAIVITVIYKRRANKRIFDYPVWSIGSENHRRQ